MLSETSRYIAFDRLARLIVLLLFVIGILSADKKQAHPPDGEDRISGQIQSVSPAPSGQGTIVTVESGAGHVRRRIFCDVSTPVSFMGKAANVTEVKKDRTITCWGTLTNQQFSAAHCDVQ